MFNQLGADIVSETVEHSFDWASAAVGAGSGAALILLLLALAATRRSVRRASPRHNEGRRS